MKSPTIVVLCGGVSAEREVSLGSGRACASALARSFPTRCVDVTAAALPAGIDPDREIVFSTLHGTFGEDGGMQRLLESAGIEFAGSGAESCTLTIDKTATKALVAARGIRGPRGLAFDAGARPAAEDLMAQLGDSIVLKPNSEGSSVGLKLPAGVGALRKDLAALTDGRWLAEERIVGRELSVGVIDGRALGIVEVRPNSGVYDYASKYTKGLTEYLAPAPLADEIAARVRAAAETIFGACGCRDYARVDFILSASDTPFFLEINTLPGMKETSLLPMSARCAGMDFTALVRAMVGPALMRFSGRQAVRVSP